MTPCQNELSTNCSRQTLAFLLAPLVVPMSFALWLAWGHLAPAWVVVSAFVSALFTYGGTAVFGIPAYKILLRSGWTALWVAVVTGFVIGMITWIIFGILFALSLDEGMFGVRAVLIQSKDVVKNVVWPGGVFGMIVGVLFWIIARPDRKHA